MSIAKSCTPLLVSVLLIAGGVPTGSAAQGTVEAVSGSDIEATAIANCDRRVGNTARLTSANISPSGTGTLRYGGLGATSYICFTDTVGKVVYVQRKRDRR